MKKLEGILASTDIQADLIESEMQIAAEKYGNKRQTIVHPYTLGKFSAKDTIPDEEMIVVLTEQNYVKRLSPTSFRSQKRGGVGVVGAKTKDEDTISKTAFGSNHNDLLFFTSTGRVFALPTYEIPEASRTAKGTPIVNLLQLREDEKVTAILNLSKSIGEYVFFCTTGGTVKRVALDQFTSVRRSGLIACGLREGEQLLWTRVSSGQDDVFIVTREGKSIRFSENDVRVMGRSATGVRGIKLKGDDVVMEMDLLQSDEAKLLVVMQNGLGKMSKVNLYREQSRGGTGIKVANITEKTGKVAGARVISPGLAADLLLVTEQGQTMRMGIDGVKTSGRSTQGVILMRPSKNDKINSISLIIETPEEKVAPEKLAKAKKKK